MNRVLGCVIVLTVMIVMAGCSMVPAQTVAADTIETVDQTSSVINNMGMDWKTLLLFTLLAGWAIPSPSQIFGWLAGPLSFIKWW
jgi:uncharacterized protein YceK